MTALPLTTAIATYGHTRALKDGAIRSPRVVLKHRDVTPITSAFRQMVRHLAFDVSEMALSTYLCARVSETADSLTYLPHAPIRTWPDGLQRAVRHPVAV